MPTPDPLPLLLALGHPEAAPPTTAKAWALLGMQARHLRDTGLCGRLHTGADPRNGSRLFGPLLVQSGLDPHHWAALAVINLADTTAQGLELPPSLVHLPPHGWLHIALPRATAAAGIGDVRICHIPAEATPLSDTGYGFGWADEAHATTGLAIDWSQCSAPKPPGWFGFEHARTAIWGLGLSGDDTLEEERLDAFYTAVEDRLDTPAPAVSLGLEPHWTQDSPATTDPRFAQYPPLLALHAGPLLALHDGGTLGIHADMQGADPSHWRSVWSIDSL